MERVVVSPKEAISAIKKAREVFVWARLDHDDMRQVRAYKYDLIETIQTMNEWMTIEIMEQDGDLFVGL